jgi:hypothetical protein
MNKAWHAAHPMPPKATREQRVRWHAAHLRACACRPVPESLQEDVGKWRVTPARAKPPR